MLEVRSIADIVFVVESSLVFYLLDLPYSIDTLLLSELVAD